MVVTREPARQGHGEWEIGVGGIGERHVNFELLAGYNAIRKRLSGRIKAAIAVVLICVIIVLGSAPSIAGTLEDAAAAYKRGNYAAALQLYRSLADKGNAIAQDSLGDMYNYGKGVPQNQAEAEQWYRLAAKQGLAKAQNNMGFLSMLKALRTGDYSESVKWYRLSAGQGDAHGQLALGGAYKSGLGVPQNYVEAAKWFLRAAEQGKDSAAWYMLGLAYARGQGVPQDYIRAYKWLNLAAAKGQPFAKDRDFVAGSMTAAQIAEAQKLAAEWSPKTARESLNMPPQSPSLKKPSPKEPETAATGGNGLFRFEEWRITHQCPRRRGLPTDSHKRCPSTPTSAR